jgi:hypothetical protein
VGNPWTERQVAQRGRVVQPQAQQQGGRGEEDDKREKGGRRRGKGSKLHFYTDGNYIKNGN